MGLNEQAIVQLRQLVADVLNVSHELVTLDSGPTTLPQWDSFNHIHLIVALEERYQIEMDVDEIANMVSVREIALVLEQKNGVTK